MAGTNKYVTKQEAEKLFGSLSESSLVDDQVLNSLEESPVFGYTEFTDENGKVHVKLLISYYYFNENSQVLIAETKNKENTTKEFVEKVWEYNSEKNKFIHDKFVNGELRIQTEQDEGYGKPKDIAEFEHINENQNFRVQADGNGAAACFLEDLPSGAEPCCLFSGVSYNYCGAYCGYGQSAGGGEPVNGCDRCCVTHDICLSNNSSRCGCDEDIFDCLSNYSCPGDSIMGAGLRVPYYAAGC